MVTRSAMRANSLPTMRATFWQETVSSVPLTVLRTLLGHGLDAAVVRNGDAASFHQQAEPLEGIGQHLRNPVRRSPP